MPVGKYPKTGAGFTLIELLVVISIIGLLASVVLISLNSARGKARDIRRRADTRQLQTAIEFYYDTNGDYPSIGVINIGYDISGLSGLLAPYLSSLPQDPSGNSWHTYQYVRGSTSGNPPFGHGIYARYESTGYCRTGIDMNPAWWGVGECQ